MSKQGVAIQKTGVTVVTPVTTYARMSASVLDDFIKSQYAQCRSLYCKLERNSDTLYLALAEMETRFQKQERFRTDLRPLKATTWHQYLQSRGVQPAAFRQWKHRKLQSLVKSATPVVVNINVSAAELARELESSKWVEKLSEVIKSRNRLSPVVSQRLVTALRGASKQLAALADQFGSLAEDSGCSVTIVRQALPRQLRKQDVTETPVLRTPVLNGTKKISFAYPGGKAKLATTLCTQFPQSGARFVDVFAGRGNLMWRAMQLLNYDQWWVNDIRTADFFETLLTHGHLITVPERSREEYDMQKAGYTSKRTPESVLLQPYLTFSGGGYVWSGCRGGYGQVKAGISQEGYQRMLERAHRMLMSKDVRITKLDYKDVLAELGENDFVYLDPPYKDSDVRAYESADIDHAELIEILKNAKFKWAMSEYRNPVYLEAFGEPGWSQERRITFWRPKSGVRASGDALPKRTECLWTADECAAAFAIEEAA